MHGNTRVALGALLVGLGACAQNSAPSVPAASATTAAPATDIMADLGKDVRDVEQKFVDLAKAMPEGAMAWRPMPGVRSDREVFLHIAGENYLISSFMGAALPAETGINAADMKTVETYEKRDVKKDQAVSELQASFAQLRKAMSADSSAHMGDKVNFFGGEVTRQQAWMGTVTHLHEHLGQAIAYARSNKVVPPWSK